MFLIVLFQVENSIVYYFSFDPYSLIDRRLDISCGLDEKGSPILDRFRPISILEAGIPIKDLHRSITEPSKNLFTVLKNLKELVGGNEKIVNFLIDEVNQEILTEDYSTELAKGLKEHFGESTVVMALQSVEKVREVRRMDNTTTILTKEMNIDPLKEVGVEIFDLTKVARMSAQLYQLQRILEDEKSEFKCPLKEEEKTNNSKF